nr:copia protein [Tanacetum cinerariifolium]
ESVAQGHTQEKGIDYDEVFALVSRIKVIRLFLAYASFKDFVGYQMDVKSVFLYGKIENEVYVCQHPGFEDADFPDKVYKVKKALYGLHQAPRAWHKDDICFVQVYVDDIIFGSTKKELCNAFEKMMHEKFQMSFIGELTFFLGLQVKQKQDKIFISQDKYVAEIQKKYGFSEVKNATTPMETQNPLLKDEDGEEVDVHMYRSMIGSLMYLTSSRPDIMFAIQVAQKKVKKAFENADLSSRVELIPSKIKYANKVALPFHKEFSVLSSLPRKENDGLLQVFNNREEVIIKSYLIIK